MQEEEDEGSGAGLGAPEPQRAAYEEFRHHMKAPAWPYLPVSSVWRAAKNLKLPHLGLTYLVLAIQTENNYFVCCKSLEVITG